MRAALVAAGVLLVAACAKPEPRTVPTGAVNVPKGNVYRYTFDDDQPPPPGNGHPGWWGGEGRRKFHSALGDWEIRADARAPSAPNVYRQRRLHAADDSPRVLVGDLWFEDHTVRVKCRPESGSYSGGGCALVFHAESADDYVVAEADAGDHTIHLVHVERGEPREIAWAKARVDEWQWHELMVTTRGPWITVSWNGERVIQATEHARGQGHVGLATRRGGVTSFDDLEIRAD